MTRDTQGTQDAQGGRVGKPTGLSSPTEPQEGLGPTGFDPSREASEEVRRLVALAWKWGNGCAVDDIFDIEQRGDSYNEGCRDDTETAAALVRGRLRSLEAEVVRLRLSRKRTRVALETLRRSRDSDRSGEAGETGTGSTVGESPGPEGIAQRGAS